VRTTSDKACERKLSYPSSKAASKALNAQSKLKNKKFHTLRPYQCNVCNKWHLGHKFNSTIQKVIDGLKGLYNEQFVE
jgi:hypothetical protein